MARCGWRLRTRRGACRFGIGGIEAGRAPYTSVIRDVFAAARAAGLHACRTPGRRPGGMRLGGDRVLHAERIGHGIRSLEDPALVHYLAERRLPVDVSPTSNVCTRCVPSIAGTAAGDDRGGLFVTLNSDDPPMFGTSLSNEYWWPGATSASPGRPRGAGGERGAASFLGEAEKEALLAEIAAVRCREPALREPGPAPPGHAGPGGARSVR